MKAYCLSGLGADKRAFSNFEPKGLDLVHIDWHKPNDDETLEQYASTIAKKITSDGEPFMLIGLSFGGMVAIEIAKILKPAKLIVISSLLTKHELRGKTLRLPLLFPHKALMGSNFITRYLFGVSAEVDKQLLSQILQETDLNFIKWGLNAMLNWKNTEKPDCFRIHGTNDRILPATRDINYPVKNGGHFMISNRAEEITKIVEQEIGVNN